MKKEKEAFIKGKLYCRTAPVKDIDFSFMKEKHAIVFKEYKPDGRLVFLYNPNSFEGRFFEDEEIVLVKEWDDGNWRKLS